MFRTPPHHRLDRASFDGRESQLTEHAVQGHRKIAQGVDHGSVEVDDGRIQGDERWAHGDHKRKRADKGRILTHQARGLPPSGLRAQVRTLESRTKKSRGPSPAFASNSRRLLTIDTALTTALATTLATTLATALAATAAAAGLATLAASLTRFR